MKNFVYTQAAAALFLVACSHSESEEPLAQRWAELTVGQVEATVSLQNDWGSGYCADVILANHGSAAISDWRVELDPHDSTIGNLWNGALKENSVTPTAHNTTVQPGQSVTFGFCANATGPNYLPDVVGLDYQADGTSGGSSSGDSTSDDGSTGGTTGDDSGSDDGSTGGTSSGGSDSTGGTSSGGSDSTGGTSSGGSDSTGGTSSSSATLTIDNDWGSGYCATVDPLVSGEWTVVLNMNDSEINNLWNGSYSGSGSMVTVTGNADSFGFCARSLGSNYLPSVVSVNGDTSDGGTSSGGTTSTGGNSSDDGSSTGGTSSGGTDSGGTGSGGDTGGSTGGTGDSSTGGDGQTVNGCGFATERDTTPFGCNLAWGANGNDGNRSDYLDFISTWVGYEHFQGRSGACDGCGLASALEHTDARAVYYAYVAGYALDDCNVNPDGPNLCTHGAQWLRDNRDLYLDLYADYAAQTYQASPSKGVAWLLEGDFVQYTYSEQQNPFSMAELGQLARDVVCTIKANAPNALVGLNHSTWISNEQTNSYWNAMPTDVLDFVWTTGVGNNDGYMESGTTSSTYNAQTARYDYLSDLTGLGLFVDTSFGLSQMSDSWSGQTASTLNQRLAEGVMAVNVTEPPSDYASRLSGLRPQLDSVCQ